MAIAAESRACGSCSWQVEHVDDDHGNEYWQANGIGKREEHPYREGKRQGEAHGPDH